MKSKQRKRIISGLVAVTVAAMYLFLPPVRTAGAVSSIYNAKDLMSDSDFGVTATHTFTFTTSTTTKQNDYFRFAFPAGFTTVGAGSETCMWGDADFNPATTTAAARMIDCTYTGVPNIASASSTQAVFTGITNPLTEDTQGYSIWVSHYGSNGLLKEQVELKVYIISSVRMTANVRAILTFAINGMDTSDTVNNIPCSRVSYATSTDFGTLTTGANASTTICQELRVATNAADGYVVTVEQDHELLSASSDTINSFNNSADGTGSSTEATARTWTAPTSILDQEETYGHMGFHSDDSNLESLAGAINFDSGGTVRFAGFAATTPIPVLHHDGPTTNSVQNAGMAHILYKAQIGVLQESGDYENQLTYIATATY